MDNQYAEIIVGMNQRQVDRIFSYRIPPSLSGRVQEGMVVEVPFGNGNRKCRGYVIRVCEKVDCDLSKLKEIGRLLNLTPVFSREQLEMARWIQKRYDASLASCLALFVPKKAQKAEKADPRFLPVKGVAETAKVRGAQQKKALAYLLRAQGPVALSELRGETGITLSSLRSMVDRQWIAPYQEPEGEPPAAFHSRDPETFQNPKDPSQNPKDPSQNPTDPPKELHEEQKEAYLRVAEACKRGEHRTFLLQGITGSGKTEVYMQLIRYVLDRGKQAIVLAPEISLTPQLIDVFTRRFGSRVGVTHSRLSDSERTALWHRARRGELSVMVGPRSALFTPFTNLGLIILDEEHENTYKSEQTPRYHAREVAIEIGKRLKIPVLLGSATPSVVSYYKAEHGEYTLLKLKKRAIPGARLPEVRIVDMRRELAEGNPSLFCRQLTEAVRERLSKNEQVILFLNRKGYSTFVNCRSCGFVLKCPRCFLPYTWHKDRNLLICHHCGKEVRPVSTCPACGSPYIRHFGAGTQRVEEEIRGLFPEARVMRMDTSVIRGEETYQQMYEQFRDRKGDILIGTQMIAKGFDFPYVTLVGVLAADMILYSDDYHSTERTYQLLTQVAGRAGRSGRAGEVVIQTYSPEHYCIQDASRHDYESFYKSELTARKLMDCPPFTHILQYLLTGSDEEKVRMQAEAFYELLCRYGGPKGFRILSPAPASLERINNVFRWRILVRLAERERLNAFGAYCRDRFLEKDRSAKIQMDIDPVFMI